MPIPTPRKGEKERDFISRCIRTVRKIDPERPQKQVIAICFDTWRKKRGESSMGIEFKEYWESELARITSMEAERKKRGMSVAQFYAFPRLKKLPVFDAAHTRNAMARFNQTQGMTASEKATAYRKILRAAKKFNIDVSRFKQVRHSRLGIKDDAPHLPKKFTITSRQLGNEKNLVIYMENSEGFCEGWSFSPVKVAQKNKLILGSKVRKLSRAPIEMLKFDGIIPIGKPGASRNYVGIYRILDQGTYKLLAKESGNFKYEFMGKKFKGTYEVKRLEDRELIESSKYQYTFDKAKKESLTEELLAQLEFILASRRTEEKLYYNNLKITSELTGSVVPLTIRGIALKEGNWNGLYYPEDEIMKAAILLQGKPLMLDHSKSVKDVAGKVIRAWFNPTLKAIEFEAEVIDEPIAKKIIEGLVDSVSVGVIVDRIREGTNLIARNYEFKELSLVLVPACADAKITEKIPPRVS